MMMVDGDVVVVVQKRNVVFVVAVVACMCVVFFIVSRGRLFVCDMFSRLIGVCVFGMFLFSLITSFVASVLFESPRVIRADTANSDAMSHRI